MSSSRIATDGGSPKMPDRSEMTFLKYYGAVAGGFFGLVAGSYIGPYGMAIGAWLGGTLGWELEKHLEGY